jgi:hypothetical protein
LIRSVALYSKYFLCTIASPHKTRAALLSATDLYMTDHRPPANDEVESAVESALQWLLHSQASNSEGGFATYDFAGGYTSPYPETTGYIVESLLMWPELRQKPEIRQSAEKALQWLLAIQKPSGGWQGGYLHENRPEIVFNTGQVIRGLLEGYVHLGGQHYLDAATRAADWLVSIQHPEGYWNRHVYLNEIRVYDTYVAAPLYKLGKITENQGYKDAALKNANWVVGSQLLKNGWFQNADNSKKHNHRPILHTIAYTLDGLLDLALATGDGVWLDAALTTATALKAALLQDKRLKGRYDKRWYGQRSICNTGVAQCAVIFAKLHLHYRAKIWKDAYNMLVNYLLHHQIRTPGVPYLHGGITGSSPLWGRYEPFRIPNWGVKYFLDAMMYNSEVNCQKQ